jgi:two-component system, response regulator PdtaR
MKLRILIVEDETIIAACLEKDLLKLGYEVLPVASTAEKAVTLTEEHRPDIILMDIILQGKKTGIDAAQEIVKTHTMPIFFLTGNPCLLEGIEWVQKPTYRIIPKPIIIQQLYRFIEEALG